MISADLVKSGGNSVDSGTRYLVCILPMLRNFGIESRSTKIRSRYNTIHFRRHGKRNREGP